MAPQQFVSAGYFFEIIFVNLMASSGVGIFTFDASTSWSTLMSTRFPNCHQTLHDAGTIPYMKQRNLFPPLERSHVNTSPRHAVAFNRRFLPALLLTLQMLFCPCGVNSLKTGAKIATRPSNACLWKPQSWIRLSSCPAL